MSASEVMLVVHLAATGVMVGVIWFVQLVHYPLLALVGMERATEIAVEHQRRTLAVVALPMCAEGVTTLAILLAPPDGVNAWLPWAGAVLLAVALGSTVLLSVPLHAEMAERPTVSTGRRLVRTNWPRTIAWTLRLVIAALMFTAGT